MEGEAEVRILEKADPRQQTSLQSEVIPDPMEGEQTWPTEEELADGKGDNSTVTLSFGERDSLILACDFT